MPSGHALKCICTSTVPPTVTTPAISAVIVGNTYAVASTVRFVPANISSNVCVGSVAVNVLCADIRSAATVYVVSSSISTGSENVNVTGVAVPTTSAYAGFPISLVTVTPFGTPNTRAVVVSSFVPLPSGLVTTTRTVRAVPRVVGVTSHSEPDDCIAIGTESTHASTVPRASANPSVTVDATYVRRVPDTVIVVGSAYATSAARTTTGYVFDAPHAEIVTLDARAARLETATSNATDDPVLVNPVPSTANAASRLANVTVARAVVSTSGIAGTTPTLGAPGHLRIDEAPTATDTFVPATDVNASVNPLVLEAVTGTRTDFRSAPSYVMPCASTAAPAVDVTDAKFWLACVASNFADASVAGNTNATRTITRSPTTTRAPLERLADVGTCRAVNAAPFVIVFSVPSGARTVAVIATVPTGASTVADGLCGSPSPIAIVSSVAPYARPFPPENTSPTRHATFAGATAIGAFVVASRTVAVNDVGNAYIGTATSQSYTRSIVPKNVALSCPASAAAASTENTIGPAYDVTASQLPPVTRAVAVTDPTKAEENAHETEQFCPTVTRAGLAVTAVTVGSA